MLKSSYQVVMKCLCPQRATAGLRRTTAELTDGNQDNGSSGNNSPVNDSPTPIQPTDPVAMEISSSPLERENLVSWRGQEVEELHYTEAHEMQQPIKDKQEEEEAGVGENGETDGDECDYLVFEIGEQKEGKEIGESEGGKKTEGGEEGVDGGRGGTDGQDEGRGKVEAEDGSKGERESAHWGRREIEGEDEGGVKKACKDEGIGETEGEDGGSGDSKDAVEWVGKTGGEMKADALAELLFLSESSVCPSSSETLIAISYPSEDPAATMLQEAWAHDLGNRDDLSDCLQAELAIVYSDSDAGEDQWSAFVPCDVTNQEEAGGGIRDSICDGESKKEERGRENEEREEEVEKRRGSRDDDDDEEQMRSRRDVFLRSPSVSSTASSTDPDRRVRPPPLSEFIFPTGSLKFYVARWKVLMESPYTA